MYTWACNFFYSAGVVTPEGRKGKGKGKCRKAPGYNTSNPGTNLHIRVHMKLPTY
jgi:hypothetical protein